MAMQDGLLIKLSSAIITACLKALMEFYEVNIPKAIQAGLILAVENNELKIPAGLQDRVIQAYEGAVFMDFDKNLMKTRGYGEYEELKGLGDAVSYARSFVGDEAFALPRA